ncbi:hypothetical protein Pelo_10394 [Pelomyxa schiedti]|nr:hypothetical protein Pelo_10394 [Pelomyxa schiedti]
MVSVSNAHTAVIVVAAAAVVSLLAPACLCQSPPAASYARVYYVPGASPPWDPSWAPAVASVDVAAAGSPSSPPSVSPPEARCLLGPGGDGEDVAAYISQGAFAADLVEDLEEDGGSTLWYYFVAGKTLYAVNLTSCDVEVVSALATPIDIVGLTWSESDGVFFAIGHTFECGEERTVLHRMTRDGFLEQVGMLHSPGWERVQYSVDSLAFSDMTGELYAYSGSPCAMHSIDPCDATVVASAVCPGSGYITSSDVSLDFDDETGELYMAPASIVGIWIMNHTACIPISEITPPDVSVYGIGVLHMYAHLQSPSSSESSSYFTELDDFSDEIGFTYPIENWLCSVCPPEWESQIDLIGTFRDPWHYSFGYVMHVNGMGLLVVIRGIAGSTLQWMLDGDLRQDLYPLQPTSGKLALVHSGFLQITEAVKLAVEKLIREGLSMFEYSDVVFAGHSMGGSVAALLAPIVWADLSYDYDLPRGFLKVITLGQPRVGNAGFNDVLLSATDFHHRVIHHCDPVPQVPSDGYTHFATEHWISVCGGNTSISCDSSGEDPSCSRSCSTEEYTSHALDHNLYYNVAYLSTTWSYDTVDPCEGECWSSSESCQFDANNVPKCMCTIPGLVTAEVGGCQLPDPISVVPTLNSVVLEIRKTDTVSDLLALFKFELSGKFNVAIETIINWHTSSPNTKREDCTTVSTNDTAAESCLLSVQFAYSNTSNSSFAWFFTDILHNHATLETFSIMRASIAVVDDNDTLTSVSVEQTDVVTDPSCSESCLQSWIGDGMCDIGCLVASCQYDQGDCPDVPSSSASESRSVSKSSSASSSQQQSVASTANEQSSLVSNPLESYPLGQSSQYLETPSSEDVITVSLWILVAVAGGAGVLCILAFLAGLSVACCAVKKKNEPTIEESFSSAFSDDGSRRRAGLGPRDIPLDNLN